MNIDDMGARLTSKTSHLVPFSEIKELMGLYYMPVSNIFQNSVKHCQLPADTAAERNYCDVGGDSGVFSLHTGTCP